MTRRLALSVLGVIVALGLVWLGVISSMFGAEAAFSREAECRGDFSLLSKNPHCWGPPFWSYSGIAEVLIGLGVAVAIVLVSARRRRRMRLGMGSRWR